MTSRQPYDTSQLITYIDHVVKMSLPHLQAPLLKLICDKATQYSVSKGGTYSGRTH